MLCPPVTLQWCNFSGFQADIKSIFAFWLKNLEFFSLPNISSLFLSLTVIWQQFPFVVVFLNNGEGFWRAKLPSFYTKPYFLAIFKLSLILHRVCGIGLKSVSVLAI